LPTVASPVLRIGLLGAARIARWAIVDPARQRHDVALQAVAALQAGKAVLCEKPLALSTGEVNAMFDAADAAQRPLWEAFHHQHHPAMQLFLAQVRSGAIGALQRVEASFNGHMPYTADEFRWQATLGGGAIMDLGCYALHPIRALLGDPLRVVSAQAQMQAGVDAALSAELVNADGVSAQMECSFLAAHHKSLLVATGQLGTLRFENFTFPNWQGALVLETAGGHQSLPITAPSTYEAQLDFVCRSWSHAPAGRHRADSLANMALIEAVRHVAGLR
jgi:predicted dehydrogenase